MDKNKYKFIAKIALTVIFVAIIALQRRRHEVRLSTYGLGLE